jgi:hypothetical protein
MLNHTENYERRKSNEGRLDVPVRRYGLAFPLYHRLQLDQSLDWFRMGDRETGLIETQGRNYPQ